MPSPFYKHFFTNNPFTNIIAAIVDHKLGCRFYCHLDVVQFIQNGPYWKKIYINWCFCHTLTDTYKRFRSCIFPVYFPSPKPVYLQQYYFLHTHFMTDGCVLHKKKNYTRAIIHFGRTLFFFLVRMDRPCSVLHTNGCRKTAMGVCVLNNFPFHTWIAKRASMYECSIIVQLCMVVCYCFHDHAYTKPLCIKSGNTIWEEYIRYLLTLSMPLAQICTKFVC